MAYNDDHTYIPTEWVDDMEPPIDAEHLNKIEQALKKNGESLNEMAEAIGEGGQLKANGFVYVDKIETGIEPAPDPTLDADKLGGKLSEEYALRAELNSATPVTQGDYFEFAKGNYIAVAGLTNAPNSTDAFFVRVTVDGTQKILQAMDLTTGQEFVNYYNGTSWLANWVATELAGGLTSILINVSDFNSVTKPGHYYATTTLQTQNSPPNTNNGYLEVYSADSNSVTQIFKPWTEMVFYTRQQKSGVWSDWDSVVMGSQIQGKYTEVQSLSPNVTFTEVGYIRSGNVVVFKGFIKVVNASSTGYIIANIPKSINSGAYQTQFFYSDIEEVPSTSKRLALEATPQGTMMARFGEAGKSYLVMYTYICED